MKFALIAFGNEESYGLLFVGGELLEYNQQIHFFDAEETDVVEKVVRWGPDFVMFSPMTTFYSDALSISRTVKACLHHVVSVFGGHHAMASPEIIKEYGIDIVVVGPVRGSIQEILDGVVGVIKTEPTTPRDMARPDRLTYYRDIPRMAKRYRKVMLAMPGCPWNCSYCSSSSEFVRKLFGVVAHRNYYLSRRPIEHVIDEALEIIKYPTKEIEWVDDDVFSGINVETWLVNFVEIWKREINLPLYVSTTSVSVLRASDKVLRTLKQIVNVVGLGIQAIRPESLKLFNRQWDYEEKMKAAYDRLRSFGYSVNLQCIVGLPVIDPIEDALDTIKGMQRIGAGSICSCYPLQIYPSSAIKRYCDGRVKLNSDCSGDTNTGITGINFTESTQRVLRNICKLATLFVKYNISEEWMRALIYIDFNDETSKKLSMARYKECVVDRLKEDGSRIFQEIAETTNVRY